MLAAHAPAAIIRPEAADGGAADGARPRAVPLDVPELRRASGAPAVQGARGDRRVLDEAAEKALPLHEIEKEYIKKILEKTGGNKYQAAHALGIDRKTLYRKLAEIEGKPHPEE